MADDDIGETLGEAELVEGLERKKVSGKKIIIIGVGALVAVLVIVLVIMLFSGSDEEHVSENDAVLDQLAEDAAGHRADGEQATDKSAEELKTLFIDIPEQLYNLKTTGEGTSFLKATIILEIDRESFRKDIEAKMPRILDEFNVYMREMRPDDLNGAAGVFRLKEELLMRINQAVAPSRVKDVLFQKFIVQS